MIEKNTRSFIFRMLLYFLVMAFFVCVVFIYYRKLYNETRDNIINKGRINAIESSNQINMRMSASMDTLKLASYTLDNMIKGRKSQEEILDYLTNETKAVEDSLIADTTGIYGYVNGEYMDGSGWDPGPDYVPTNRPWYTEAMADKGNIVIVDPYLDLDTGTIMIAIVKTLCDDKSVVGIDLSMGDIQSMVEDHVKKGHSDMEFITNKNGIIIAHSDEAMISTNLYSCHDDIYTSVSEMIKKSETGYYYINTGDRDCMVYAIPLTGEWTSVSVIDATDDFSRLLKLIVLTIMTATVILGAFVIALVRSERQSRAARDLAIKTERATAASEAKTSFLSNMSHEIRTPVNAILGMNEMILREASDESILSYSENIKSASSSLLGIINDILDFSKIESGKFEILPVDYEISSVINDLVNMVYTRADEKGLTLNLDFDKEIPRFLNGDEVRVKQVITNILTNAVKYTEKGSITFAIRHRKADGYPNSVYLDVSVKDTGIGIKPEDLDKLFSKFERIEEKRNRNIEGTGLGMNITKSLLDLMGSSLKVESTYGEGSCFSFSLLQKVVSWEPLGDYGSTLHEHLKEHEVYREKFTAPNAHVLVVDDNPMNLLVFKSLIKRTLINIDTADCGDEGIRLARKNKYDLLFLDHMMPGKDGIETLDEIRGDQDGQNTSTPAICLTANAISGAREQYISAGFDNYLTKPIDSEKLEDLLVTMLPDELVEDPLPEDEMSNTKPDTYDDLPEDIRSLDGELIDVATGLKNNMSAEIYRTVLESFFNSSSAQESELEQLYANNNYTDYTIKVHAIKSSARIIGATAFGEDAQKLEDAGKSNDTDYIHANHGDFIKSFENLKDLLTPMFEKSQDSDSEKPVADPSLMAETFEEILNAADAMDCQRLEEIFEDMTDFAIPVEDRELFYKLKNASQRFDYDAIISLLSDNSK